MNAFFVYMRLHIVRDVITEVSIEHWTENPGILEDSNELVKRTLVIVSERKGPPHSHRDHLR